MGFSVFERRALVFLILIIIIASVARFWRNSNLEQDLRLAGEMSVISEIDPEIGGLGESIISPINLNTATIAEIELLPGIGPIKAKAIIEYRDAHGEFKSVDDLQQVYGIGPKTVERLRKWVVLGDGH